MAQNVISSRWLQIVAWTVASLFVLGFFLHGIGAWTGPILGTWFVLTQKPLRGIFWQVIFVLIPTIAFQAPGFRWTGAEAALTYIGWTVAGALLAVLPFTVHRLISPGLSGFVSTLPLPLARVAIPFLALTLHSHAAPQTVLGTVLFYWLAAIVVWTWNLEAGVLCTGSVFAVATGFGLAFWGSARWGILAASTIAMTDMAGWTAIATSLALGGWALLKPKQQLGWTERPEAVAWLRSPGTANRLHAVGKRGTEMLVGAGGEQFPVRHRIPDFRRPEDLTGDNGKYNHLYETIGGFYDDIQRAFCALKGWDRDSYFRAYMGLLEVKPGDKVLETSVGTGLNYKYLPRGVRLAGIDLSPEMLANCQQSLRRRNLDADLYLGNAECLPFADASFDVVFHVGGINFFNDRAAAIREMIRVAKPGSLLLIADETEKHVKGVYEKMDLAGDLYKTRKVPVQAPIELVPHEMEEIHLEEIRSEEFYVLTFRKPAICAEMSAAQ